jgi:hypothetical protein
MSLIADVDTSAPEVGIEGWLDLEAAYAFTYLDATGTLRLHLHPKSCQLATPVCLIIVRGYVVDPALLGSCCSE